jgi:hypothetical protein
MRILEPYVIGDNATGARSRREVICGGKEVAFLLPCSGNAHAGMRGPHGSLTSTVDDPVGGGRSRLAETSVAPNAWWEPTPPLWVWWDLALVGSAAEVRSKSI